MGYHQNTGILFDNIGLVHIVCNKIKIYPKITKTGPISVGLPPYPKEIPSIVWEKLGKFF
jgi:hypothetical protein